MENKQKELLSIKDAIERWGYSYAWWSSKINRDRLQPVTVKKHYKLYRAEDLETILRYWQSKKRKRKNKKSLAEGGADHAATTVAPTETRQVTDDNGYPVRLSNTDDYDSEDDTDINTSDDNTDWCNDLFDDCGNCHNCGNYDDNNAAEPPEPQYVPIKFASNPKSIVIDCNTTGLSIEIYF